MSRLVRRTRSSSVLSTLALLLGLGAACGGEDEESDLPLPMSSDVERVTCAPSPARIDPAAARDLSSDQFAALGRERSGLAGRGSGRTATRARYVSAASGSDDDEGSEDAPWQSLQHAADEVRPDTVVYVDDSDDYEGGIELHRSGEPGAWIAFRPWEDARPRIVGGPGIEAVVDIDASFVVFEGFEIADHDPGALDDDAIGIQVEARGGDLSNIEIRNNVIHDIGPGPVDEASCSYDGHGIIVQSEGSEITNLVIDGNELHDLYVGNSEVLVVNGNIADFCVTSNYVHDVNNIAIDVIGYEKNDRETARGGRIADNVVLDASNYWPYCSRGNCTYAEGDESSNGIYVDGGANLVIEYNVVGRTDHGIELQSENGELIRDVEVAHNVVFNSNYRNFTLGDASNSFEHDNEFFDEEALADDSLEGCR